MIDYEEFKSANRNSRIATRFATAALLVSIVSTCFSIYFSNEQIDSKTKINQGQLNKILQLKVDEREITQRLAEVLERQKLQFDQLKKIKTNRQDKHSQANSADAKNRSAD